MSAQNKRVIYRLALNFLNDLKPVPQTLDDVCDYARSRAQRNVSNVVMEAVTYCQEAGYLERCERRASDEALWKITATGIRQIEGAVRPDELDPMIWE